MANDLEQKIVKQLEYYFGDVNLPQDKFMQEKVKDDEGWVPIEVLLTFKRLAILTKESEVIATAVEQSKSELVLVSEDKTKLRRNPELPAPEMNDDRRKELLDRTAYAKGFPADEELDEIIKNLESHGPIESCNKRSYLNKATKQQVFKGSCFVTFKNVDDCKKFVEAESVKYKETELIRKFKERYIEGKREEVRELRNARKKDKEAAKVAAVESTKLELPKGATLAFSGVAEGQVLTREEIRDKVKEIAGANPTFINYSKSSPSGHVRFPNENDAVEFAKKLTDGALEIGEAKLTFRVLEGDEEEEYLKAAAEDLRKIRQAQKKGKWGKRRGKQDNWPAAKKARTDDD